MSRNTKLVLSVFAGTALVLFLCAGASFMFAGGVALSGVAQVMEFDSHAVAEKAASIADFQLPDGFRPAYAVSAGGFTVVSYDPGDDHSHLFLVQAPAWVKLNQDQFERQLRRDFGDKLNWGEDVKSEVVDHRTLRVGGQPVEFAVSEGVNSVGGDYRSMAGVWSSANGQVLIYIEEPLSRWNQAEIDAFVASIR